LFRLVDREWLCCVVLIGAGEFFEAENNELQRLEVRNLAERRSLELRQ
jgi:hypothetical protein